MDIIEKNKNETTANMTTSPIIPKIEPFLCLFISAPFRSLLLYIQFDYDNKV